MQNKQGCSEKIRAALSPYMQNRSIPVKRFLKKLGRIYNCISDVLELYLPSLIFIFLFLSYVVLIFYRYVMRSSVDWLYELNSLSFVWCGIFAASYGSRKDTHVKFTILYDHVSPTWQAVMRLVGDLFVLVLFALLLPQAVKNLQFMKVRKSSILKLPFNWVFSPFLVFMGLTILHSAINFINDILALRKGRKEERAV